MAGYHENINADKFPKQFEHNIGHRVMLCFEYGSQREIPATILRDDAESPCITVYQTDDGRIILSTECHWRSMTPAEAADDNAMRNPQLKACDRVRVMGDAADLWITGFTGNVDTYGTVAITPKLGEYKTLVILHRLGIEADIAVKVRTSKLHKI